MTQSNYATRIPHTGAPLSFSVRTAYNIGYAFGLDTDDTGRRDRYAMVREWIGTLERNARERGVTSQLAADLRYAVAGGLVDGERETARRGDQVNPHLSGAR